jgi:predicted nucleotidyltransferase
MREAAAVAESLPRAVQLVLQEFIGAARDALGDDLRSIVLYGSGAEGRLRATSDVNLIVVLVAFERERVDALRAAFVSGQAAVRLGAMFLLESELPAALESFPVKFADVRRRHRILFGDDPFASLPISRPETIRQLKQLLLNLALRMRSAYMERSLQEEQLATVVAESAGPLRACAASLLELEGTPAPTPREALNRVAGSLSESLRERLASDLDEARAHRTLPQGEGSRALFELIDLAHRMRSRAELLQ